MVALSQQLPADLVNQLQIDGPREQDAGRRPAKPVAPGQVDQLIARFQAAVELGAVDRDLWWERRSGNAADWQRELDDFVIMNQPVHRVPDDRLWARWDGATERGKALIAAELISRSALADDADRRGRGTRPARAARRADGDRHPRWCPRARRRGPVDRRCRRRRPGPRPRRRAAAFRRRRRNADPAAESSSAALARRPAHRDRPGRRRATRRGPAPGTVLAGPVPAVVRRRDADLHPRRPTRPREQRERSGRGRPRHGPRCRLTGGVLGPTARPRARAATRDGVRHRQSGDRRVPPSAGPPGPRSGSARAVRHALAAPGRHPGLGRVATRCGGPARPSRAGSCAGSAPCC